MLAFPSQPGASGMTIQMEKRTKPQKFVEVMRALDGDGTVLWLPDLARRAAHLGNGADSLWLGIADGGD